VQAFRTAAAVVDGLSADQLDLKIATNTLNPHTMMIVSHGTA